MSTQEIKMAAREIRRQVNKAVGQNFLKTIAEPVTNADSALKRNAKVHHSAGLVAEMLKLKINERVDTASLKKNLPKASPRKLKIELFLPKTADHDSRVCRVVDYGDGMSKETLEKKFACYAEAKAKGEDTRSLFGRGALDVMLYHEEAVIYSVSNGVLSRCKIYWESKTQRPMLEIDGLGKADSRLLKEHDLPDDLRPSGTVFHFRIKDGTHIPQTDQVAAKIANFYMLRLIAADPNTQLDLTQERSAGRHTEQLNYDFPVGTVIGRESDTLDLEADGTYPIEILVIRSDEELQADAMNIERRENGLLFVDDNDAVLDVTLLPEYDKSPYLKHVYGIVKINGIRNLLEAKLEAQDATAILTESRDGFDRRNEVTRKLFGLIERHVKPIYELEEKRQKKGDGTRSEELAKRVRDALKALNDFTADETEEEGDEPNEPREKEIDGIAFSTKKVGLIVGKAKRVAVFVNLQQVKSGQVVIFESDNPAIEVAPESEIVPNRKNQKIARFTLALTGTTKGHSATITALTVDKNGKDLTATLKVTSVDDPPVWTPPVDIEFSAPSFSGDPSRANTATLLVNLDAFTGMPEITFWLEDLVGKVTLGETGKERTQVKVLSTHRVTGTNVARVPVVFKGSGWGQRAVLHAKAKKKNGELALAKAKVKLERKGGGKFSDFEYEPLDRKVLGDVAGDKIYVNAAYEVHHDIFGKSQEDFNQSLETKAVAQLRAAQIVVETVVQHAAYAKWLKGGAHGLHIERDDPITSLRGYVEERRMALEPKVVKAILKNQDAGDVTKPLPSPKTDDSADDGSPAPLDSTAERSS